LEYNDGLNDDHLDMLRQFVSKRKEFELQSKKDKLAKNQKRVGQSLDFGDKNKQGTIYDNGGFISTKKVNGDKLPKIEHSFADGVNTTKHEVEVLKSNGVEELRDKMVNLKKVNEIKHQRQLEKQKIQANIKSYTMAKKVSKTNNDSAMISVKRSRKVSS